MTAAEESQTSDSAPLWYVTNPDELVEYSHAHSLRDISPIVRQTTIGDFFKLVGNVDTSSNEKMGSCFLLGPCYGNKTKDNIPHLNFVLLDADSSFNENMDVVDGAPDPVEAHEFLKAFNITHCIFTSYSHGSLKGNRYRIVFPVRCENEGQQRAVAAYFAELLQKKGNLRFVLTPESYRWSQVWQYPRLKNEYSPFYTKTHFGYSIDAEGISKYYDFASEKNSRLPQQELPSDDIDEFSLSGQLEKYLPVPVQLMWHGYTFWSQGHQKGIDGTPQAVQRWAKPGDDETPGVVVFEHCGRKYAYSHYSNDPLANGRSNSAWETFVLLNGLSEASADTSKMLMAQELQAKISDELNQTCPSILLGGADFKFGNLYHEETGGITYKYMAKDNFMLYTANQPPVYELKPREEGGSDLVATPRGKFWIASRDRETYNGIRYVPTPMTEPVKRSIADKDKIYFNIFTGWSVEPKKGTWEYLSWHLLNSVCGENLEHYEYLLDWFAHLVQKPDEKPGVALVIKGKKGWGKSEVFGRLINALAPNSIVIANARQLTGNFNSHLQNKVIAMVEEAFWAGDPQAEGPLKMLITDTGTTFEAKHEKAVGGKSYVRVIMITNNEWVVPVSQDERRYFIPTMSDASYMRNLDTKYHPSGDFFPFLYEEMDAGGVRAFYYDMMNRPLSSSIRVPPKSRELSKQLELTFSKEEAWAYDFLMAGGLYTEKGESFHFDSNGVTIPAQTVLETMKSYIPIQERRRSSMARLKAALDNHFPKCASLINSGNGVFVRFSRLEVCRAAFQKSARIKVDFPEDAPTMDGM